MASLALGTASFAGKYGIKGDDVPDMGEQLRILSVGCRSGIDILDAADSYPPYPCMNVARLDGYRRVYKTRQPPSLDMLHETPLYAAMLHMPADVRLLDNLRRLKQWGAVEKVGVSAYDFDQLWATGAEALDIVQVPLNILDNRLLPTLRDLHRHGVEVHVRSAFLQGALLMDPADLPPHFDSVRDHLYSWRAQVDAVGLTPVQAALGPLLGLDCVEAVVVGVNSVAQLKELLAVQPLPWDDRWAIDDVNILEPWRWPK